MKKLLKVMILFVSIGLFPKLVQADCGLTSYKNYNAIVSNKSGASTYESDYDNQTNTTTYKKLNIIIPYNDEIAIKYDELKQGNLYFLHIDYNGKDYIVNSKDLSNNNNKEILIDKTKKTNYYTYEDTEVRSGPGVLYDIAGIIPADTNVEANVDLSVVGDGEESDSGAWVYISDGKTKGYIYYDKCNRALPIKIGTKVSKKDYYFVGTDKYNLNVEFGTKINVKYYIRHAHGGEYYIEVNGKTAIVDETEIAESYNHKLMIINLEKDGFFLGENIEKANNPETQLNINEYLKNGEKYQISYYTSDDYCEYYFFEINNKIYTIAINPYNFESNYDYPYIIMDKKETIKFKEDMYYGFQTLKDYKIMKKGQSIDGYKILNTYSDDEQYYNEKLGFFYKVSSNSNIKKDMNEDEKIVKVKGINSKQHVTICLIVSIVIAIITTIIIILINKNNKKVNKA